MDLLQLKYFKTVADFMSFTKAANFLYISQPALSKMIKNLEVELDIKLFERKLRQIELTKNGEIFLSSVNKIFGEIDYAKERMLKNEIDEEKTINIITSSNRFTSDPILSFTKDHPDEIFNVETLDNHTIINKLMSEEADFAISFFKIEHSDIQCDFLYREDIVLVTPPEYDAYEPKDYIYEANNFKHFLFISNYKEYNQFIKNKLYEKGIKYHNFNYVDDALFNIFIQNRKHFTYLPVAVCRNFEIPYATDQNLLISKRIFISKKKDNQLKNKSKTMYNFILDYYQKYEMNYRI